MRNRFVRATAAAAALVLGLSACADRGGEEESPPAVEENESWVEVGYFPQGDGAGEPQQGGTLTFAEYAETRSYDPSMVIPTASSGGNSLIALYDLLVAYNVETEEYEPKLAEAVEANDDFTEWTITLRPGVQFTDGTALDADAVVGSMNWFMGSTGFDVSIIGPLWGGVEKVDDLTVRITLTEAWANFDSMLARSLGMIVAPAAIEGDEFQPIGAGAFTVKSYAPGENLIFEANPDYWDGEPYLDELRFVWLGGDQTVLESYDAGSINGGYVNNVLVVSELAERDVPRSSYLSNLGHVIQMNHKEGNPGAYPKARKAMYLATDVEMLSDRVYDGKSIWGKRIFAQTSQWNEGEMDQNPVDVEQAKTLLEEAKAEGYDGKIHVVGTDTPTTREVLLTLKAQWESVGFEVETENIRAVADLITRVFVEKSYSVTSSGLNTLDEDPYPNLFSSFHSSAGTNIMTNNDPEFDALLEELRATPLNEAQDVINRIEEHFEEVTPAIPASAFTPTTFWTEETHGIRVIQEGMTDFSKAWVAN